MEFLIRRTDGDWFSLNYDRFREVFLLPGMVEAPGAADFRVKTAGGSTIAINYEDPGFHLIFTPGSEGKSGIEAIVEEMFARLQEATGETGKIINLG